ncbi:MAG: D-alanyl-D-alanine carboxypeptidase/D-alanyl-D-alanine-endopeptidase [Deltaproteobacteria bacterium]|nr:D-alanyl-D-alanine carboxypeptidase/D-alanyl-D-alanine-endopeptidase [Deltaproteobacteria bacterium]
MSLRCPRLLPPLLLCLAVPALAAERPAAREQDRAALRLLLENVLERTPMGQARTGLLVQSLEDGAEVFSHRADDLFNPASNVKLFTAAAALHLLGPAHRFETAFLSGAPLKNGRAGVLYVRGRGDPTLTTERLHGVASELFHAGLREVGDITCDDTWFEQDGRPPGFDQEDGDRTYLSPPGALSLNANAVNVYLRGGEVPGRPATVEVEPPAALFEVSAEVRTAPPGVRRLNVLAEPARDAVRLLVRGEAPPGEVVSLSRKVDLPALYTGHAFRRVLEARGIKVKGRVRLGAVPAGAKLLHAAESEPLDAVLRRLNKHSSNFVAEMLLRALSAAAGEQPGTTAGGVRQVEAFLEQEVGLRRGTYVLRNGSGLNDANRFSPRQVLAMLRWVHGRFSTLPEFLASLPVAGRDGTLRSRMEGTAAAGNVRAKTGTLSHVSALAGYLVTAGGEPLAFSFVVNDYEGRAGPVVGALDALCAAVAALGRPGGEGPAREVAGQLRPPAPPLEDAALQERLRIWWGLGRQGAASLPLLRSALRAEEDPAVRVAVADALARQAPDAGRRAVLESLEPSEQVYGRLRRAAAAAGLPVPGLLPLVDAAASGEAAAVERLLQLLSATPAPERLPFSGWLAELAGAAPEALLAQLHPLSPAERRPALEGLAEGLRGKAIPAALASLLERTAAGKDPTRAALAAEVRQRLVGPLSDRAATSPSP